MSPRRREVESAAAMLGRRGGLKGGKARAKAMTPAARAAVARLGGLASAKARRKVKRTKARTRRVA